MPIIISIANSQISNNHEGPSYDPSEPYSSIFKTRCILGKPTRSAYYTDVMSTICTALMSWYDTGCKSVIINVLQNYQDSNMDLNQSKDNW